MTPAGHCVTQQGKMAVVNVRTIKRDDMVQLSFQSLTHCLNTKNSENLHNVVGGGPNRVHILFTKDPHETDSICFQDPLLQGFKLSIFCDDDFLFVVRLGKMHVHLADLLNALQGHVCQHVGFNASKEDIIVHLIYNLLILLELVLVAVHDADSQYQFLSIVIIEDAV